ncbi:unnamed protein product [Paramecium pentaurelia]|uniref:Uncharacterized protein n=1 Tax=Paramecium pentaurelia TaxID=43138 RepID=A0A8S1Y487_9CILI|nr:unnamed protein product [Paramecium pentaurelia]
MIVIKIVMMDAISITQVVIIFGKNEKKEIFVILKKALRLFIINLCTVIFGNDLLVVKKNVKVIILLRIMDAILLILLHKFLC